MKDLRTSLLETLDFVAARLRARLEGLSDEELLWEPVEGCWSVRRGADGGWVLEGAGGEEPSPSPLTTIAWRLNHLAGECLADFTRMRFGDGAAPVSATAWVASAAAARSYLEDAYRGWREALGTLDAAAWESELGEAWGPYATHTTADLVLHMLDEFVHHGAEIALLRDLYRRRHELGG